jgi:hypothetical protein
MGRLLSRVAEIAIENPDLLRHPTERLRLVHQIVLAFLAFLIEAGPGPASIGECRCRLAAPDGDRPSSNSS